MGWQDNIIIVYYDTMGQIQHISLCATRLWLA